MIYSVIVTNYLGESLVMELAKPEDSGFIVKSIEGIGPGSADINTTELATADGSLFNSGRVTERNIVIEMAFDYVPTIEEVRHRTYKYFPLKKRLTLTFETDTRKCEIDGYVESNEPDIFSDKEGCQISIICPNPYFRSTSASKVLFYGVDPLFEFPFSNESLTENLLEFGRIKHYTDQNIVYEGDSETGVVVKMHAIGDVKNITIYKVETREIIRINSQKIEALTGSGLVQGDELVLSTIRPSPYIYLLRGGKSINILNAVNKDAKWFQLTKGNNIFAYSAEEGISNLEFVLEYNILYSGV